MKFGAWFPINLLYCNIWMKYSVEIHLLLAPRPPSAHIRDITGKTVSQAPVAESALAPACQRRQAWPRIAEPQSSRAKATRPQGQAALLLVESLCHILMEKEVLTRGDVIEALTTAADVKLEIALEGRERFAIANRSLGYLKAIKQSFEIGTAPAGGGKRVKH